MRNLRQLALLFLTIELLLQPLAALAQQQPPLVGDFHASVAFVGTSNNSALNRVGFQLAGNIARPLATTTGFAGLAEVAVTTVAGSRNAGYPLPCVFPGCTTTSPSNDTGLSLAPGLQWYTVTHTTKASLTLTPGMVWFVGHPAGTGTMFPKLGARFDVSWPAGTGLRMGMSAGGEFWDTDVTLPRQALTIGFTVGAR